MKQLETEIKFYLTDLPSIRQRIVDLGAQSRGRFFESNVRFEDPHRTLRKNQSLLRLRRDQTVKLTYKSTPPEENNQFKIMKELEVEVSDFDTAHLILEALGFHHEQVYEKWRETLVLDQTQFCLDSMPYGNFLEIEGPKQDIKNFAIQLGLRWDQRILLNYLHIFEIVQNSMDLNFSDVTFDNFKNVAVDLIDYLELLVAGN
ncbi:Adenylate cyclase (EC [Olavius sp. associated proteobacterium Delta 1]|nr:Adenylate cyclase (EC [Olavius sp. associated proteobacterium Delta 1]